MKYLHDTNICIYYFKGMYDFQTKFDAIGLSNIAISEITLAELYYGVEKSQNIPQNLKVVEDFIKTVGVIPITNSLYIFGKEKAKLKKKGTIISDLDVFIGAVAISNNMTLVTRNVKEFERMEGIVIENWVED